MSKMDNLRAMREARYEADRARSAKPGAPARKSAQMPADPAPTGPTPATPRKAAPLPSPATGPVATGEEARCGHRNMGGRTCTRELGHAAKSHRYS